MTNTIDPPGVCLLLLVFLVSHIGLDKPIKDIIWGRVISYNSPKLAYDTVILKDRKKDKELVFSIIAGDLLEGKKGLLFFFGRTK
jgi:hypothetical protein